MMNQKSRFRFRPTSRSSQLPPTCLIDGLYLGDLAHARNSHILGQLSITHILNAAAEADCFHRNHGSITYLHLPISDNDLFNISDFFKPAIQFIHRALSNHGAVLVHCVNGISRGPSIVIAYLVAMHHYSLCDALAFIKMHRPRIKPNRGFWHQLLVFSEQRNFSNIIVSDDQVLDGETETKKNVIVAHGNDQFGRREICMLEGETQFGSIYAAEIIAGLYLGDTYHACDMKFLRDSRITHILNAAAEVPPYELPVKVSYLHLQIRESSNTDISVYFDEAITFIDKALRIGGRVLVHSNKGMSRSVALVLAYLLARCGYSVFDALSLTKMKRPRTMPNPVFWRQLLRFAQLRMVDSSNVVKEKTLRAPGVPCS